MIQGFGVALALGAFCALAPGSAIAETRALVVGVSGYPALAESIRLTGPKNDSREFANTLVRLGVPANNVTVLADGVSNLAPGIATPGPGAKAAILSQLDKLAATSKRGDLVVFYFSGHGSQQPDLDGDEQGGADEIFLPYDVGHWGADGIENALVDDELRGRIDKILATGADFFGVIDACHSATGFRDLPGEDARSREVAPTELGVPDFAPAITRSLTLAATDQVPGRGRAAFFYAAQESEEALEKVPPNGEEGQNFGVFTYNLVKRLNETPHLTYRNLHQAVMSDIKRNTLMSTQTPEIEGDLIDEPVLQLSGAPVRRQWQIFNGKLQAGQLDGIGAGATVALFGDAAAADESAVAYGVVEQSGATKSIVTPIAADCLDAAEPCAAVADASAFKKARFARMLRPGIDLTISLSEPIRLDPADGHDYGPAVAALRSAVEAAPLNARASLKQDGYDIAVGLVDGKLAFASSAGAIDLNGPGSSPRLTIPSDPAGARSAVSDAVARIAKVMALQRLGESVDEARQVGLSAKLLVSRAKAAALQDGKCSAAEADYEPAAPVGDAPVFTECDTVTVSMANAGNKPLDVTVLLVGPDFSITPVWPQDGASSRILQSESKTAPILQMDRAAAVGSDERLIFVAVPGVGRANVVFDNLEQDGLRAAPDDPPEVAALRGLLATGLTDTTRATTAAPRIEEEMTIEVKAFRVDKSDG
jgi:hypothetical protein